MSMLNVAANDPIFFLHHANVDRIYTQWQLQHASLGYDGDLTRTLNLFGVTGSDMDSLRIADILTVTSGPLCYSYSNSVTVDSSQRPQQPSVLNFLATSSPVEVRCPDPLTDNFINQFNETSQLKTEIRSQEDDVCHFMKFAAKEVFNLI